MNQDEILLFKELCKFKSNTFDKSLLEYATPKVLGHLFYNRMQGIAYHNLKRHSLLGMVNREFRNSLKCAYEHNIARNNSFLICLSNLSKLLSNCNANIAMLKGAYLCSHYPTGCRTSNDIDLLVLPKDVTIIGKSLTQDGFKQGNIRNGEFIPATRKEIIESKMTRGETVPYIKQVDLPFMKYFEVDINFSLDYKNGETDTLDKILTNACSVKENEILIPTLNKYDFFIHLCAHLYKEATTLPWIEMHRDMTLYKYCDIYMLVDEMSEEDLTNTFVRARELNMEKVCAYSILEAAGLFDIDNSYAIQLAKETLSDDQYFILNIVDPKNKRTLRYQTHDVTTRFFMDDRADDLKVVT